MAAKTPEYNIKNISGKNILINGGMRLDQRRGGTAGSFTSTVSYTLDRWRLDSTTTATVAIQRNRNGITPPNGFTNYLGYQVTTGAAVTSTQFNEILQTIEQSNIQNLSFGTSSAKDLTLSFWVQSSVTGLYSGALRNSPANRSYVYSYTINSANTWEYKTIKINGDIGGNWTQTANTLGMVCAFCLSAGSTLRVAAGSWVGSTAVGVTGGVDLTTTTGATFYVTGVQLEMGSVATPFENKRLDQVIQECQRYYEKNHDIDTIPTFGSASAVTTAAHAASDGIFYGNLYTFTAIKRVTPTISLFGITTGPAIVHTQEGAASGNDVAAQVHASSTIGFTARKTAGVAAGTQGKIIYNFIADAEL